MDWSSEGLAGGGRRPERLPARRDHGRLDRRRHARPTRLPDLGSNPVTYLTAYPANPARERGPVRARSRTCWTAPPTTSVDPGPDHRRRSGRAGRRDPPARTSGPTRRSSSTEAIRTFGASSATWPTWCCRARAPAAPRSGCRCGTAPAPTARRRWRRSRRSGRAGATAAGMPPCVAAGPYGGALRGVLLAYKERGRHRLARPLGALLAGAVAELAPRPARPGARWSRCPSTAAAAARAPRRPHGATGHTRRASAARGRLAG